MSTVGSADSAAGYVIYAAAQAGKALQPAVRMPGDCCLSRCRHGARGGCSGIVQRVQEALMARAPPAWSARLSAREAVCGSSSRSRRGMQGRRPNVAASRREPKPLCGCMSIVC